MKITARSEWGARPPSRAPLVDSLPWERVWLHHSVTRAGGAAVMRDIQNDHLGRGWRDVAYNIAIGTDGIYEGIGIGHQHLNSDRGRSGTILLLGNYETSPVPGPMLDATAWLLAHGLLSGWWLDELRDEPHLAGGHRDIPGAAATACPGRHAHAAIAEINRRAARIIDTLGGTTMSADLVRFFRPHGNKEIDERWHSGAEHILSMNHRLSLVQASLSTLTRDTSALRTAVAATATPDEVLGLVSAALEPLVDALEGLDTTGTPGTSADVWRIIRDLADANLSP